jgi:hypothetical protein
MVRSSSRPQEAANASTLMRTRSRSAPDLMSRSMAAAVAASAVSRSAAKRAWVSLTRASLREKRLAETPPQPRLACDLTASQHESVHPSISDISGPGWTFRLRSGCSNHFVAGRSARALRISDQLALTSACLHRCFHLGRCVRNRTQPHAGCIEHRVRDSRRNDRGRRFAGAPRLLGRPVD